MISKELADKIFKAMEWFASDEVFALFLAMIGIEVIVLAFYYLFR